MSPSAVPWEGAGRHGGGCGAAWGVQAEGLPPGWEAVKVSAAGRRDGEEGGMILCCGVRGIPVPSRQEERIALRLAGWKISIGSLPTRDARWLPMPWHEVGPADGLQCWDTALCQLGHVYPTARICADILPERGTRRWLPKYGQHFLKGDRGWDAGQSRARTTCEPGLGVLSFSSSAGLVVCSALLHCPLHTLSPPVTALSKNLSYRIALSVKANFLCCWTKARALMENWPKCVFSL